jgi:hypothetical protein
MRCNPIFLRRRRPLAAVPRAGLPTPLGPARVAWCAARSAAASTWRTSAVWTSYRRSAAAARVCLCLKSGAQGQSLKDPPRLTARRRLNLIGTRLRGGRPWTRRTARLQRCGILRNSSVAGASSAAPRPRGRQDGQEEQEEEQAGQGQWTGRWRRRRHGDAGRGSGGRRALR